jgi:hypothetical protein
MYVRYARGWGRWDKSLTLSPFRLNPEVQSTPKLKNVSEETFHDHMPQLDVLLRYAHMHVIFQDRND